MATETLTASNPKKTKKHLLGILWMGLFLVAVGNPWVHALMHDALLSLAWQEPTFSTELQGVAWGALGFVVLGVGSLLASLGLPLLLLGWLEDRTQKPLSEGWALGLAFVLFCLTTVPLIFRSTSVASATDAIANVQVAETRQGFTPAVRPELERITANYRTVRQHERRIHSLATASARPKDIMPTLAAIDLLGKDHPASRFVVENGMVRSEDIEALQVALLERVRAGDSNARFALAALAP